MARFLLLIITIVCVSCGRNERTSMSETTTRTDTTIHVRDSAVVDTGSSSRPDVSANMSASDVSDWKTYRNERYHVEFKYPPGLRPSAKFSTVDIMPGTWRAMATPDEPGHAIVSVPIVHMTDRTSYPRFYDVELRIGVSDSLANCKAGNGERTIGPIVINGSTFNQFEFSDAAMMKYLSGISYRTGHNGRCYAIEQIRAGSSYRDRPSSHDIDQSRLDSIYYIAGKIVRTFRFTDQK